MKTLKLIGLLCINLLFGCNTKQDRQSDTDHYTTIRYEGCEYLTNNNHWDLTHKGNCGNFIHNNVDLPEEWPEISTNPEHPDTMIAFITNGKLNLRFNVASRRF